MKNYKRTKTLGELGELIAIKALVDNDFQKIKNLNDNQQNQKFADLYAEKNNKKFIISVKTRNKYQKQKNKTAPLKINPSYNLLHDKGYEKMRQAAKQFDAEPCWIAIILDKSSYSLFFGYVSELKGKKSISINECINGTIGTCFVKDKQHYFDYDYFGNQT